MGRSDRDCRTLGKAVGALYFGIMKARLFAIATAVLVAWTTLVHVQSPQTITVNFPTRSGASWPLFLAKEGGYYQKHGLDVTWCSRAIPPASRWWSAARRR